MNIFKVEITQKTAKMKTQNKKKMENGVSEKSEKQTKPREKQNR